MRQHQSVWLLHKDGGLEHLLKVAQHVPMSIMIKCGENYVLFVQLLIKSLV